MKRIFLSLALLIFSLTEADAQKPAITSLKKELLKLIDKDLPVAANQYLYMAKQIPGDRFPKTLDNEGDMVTSDSKWWCSGFYPGTLLYLYEHTKNDSLLGYANQKLEVLKNEQHNKGTHDIGFMMYCSYGNANRLHPNAAYQAILVNSAKSLCTRFNKVTGTIRSWNSKNADDYLVIIDNMMNLELLFYATRVTGDSSFYKIAVTHADNTMNNHFRPDYSSYHVVNYNANTGAINLKRTQQGLADNSAWARGQAWALYGYTLMYRETKDKKYLDFANHIADFILNNPNLPADKIPYWDFDAPGKPNVLKDASAGAVFASALVELSTYNKGAKAAKYLSDAGKMVLSLSGPHYRSVAQEAQGFLLKHSVGSLPQKSEVDKPLSYADYYYVEALIRFKNLLTGKKLLL